MKKLVANKEINMTEGPILSKIMLFSLPLILTNLLQTLFNAADMVIVGRFSGVEGAVGAIGATGSLINIFLNLIMGAATGATVVVATALGANDRERTQRAVHTSVLLAFLCGTIGMLVGVFGVRPMLIWMDSDPALLDMSVTYCRIYFMGVPFMAVLNYTVGILRAKGDTTSPLVILSISGGINVVLNILFVACFGMDVDGVAIATVISNVFAMGAVLYCLMKDNGPCRFSFRQLRFYPSEAARIITIGIPAGIQGTLFSLSNVFIQQGINGFGAAVVTGNSIGSNLEGFVYTATNSIAQAALTFTGQNIGARKYGRLKKITLNCYLATSIVAVVMCAFLYTFRYQLASLYMNSATENAEVIFATITDRFNYMILLYIFLAFMEVGAGIVRGMGRSILPMIVSLMGACVFRIVWIHTVFVAVHELWVLYISMPISWTLTAAVHLCCLLVLQRKLIKNSDKNAE